MFRFIAKRTFQSQSCQSSLLCQSFRNDQLYRKCDQKRHKCNENCDDNERTDKEETAKRWYEYGQCPYQLLTSKFLETIGLFGAAIVVGLNFQVRFCDYKRRLRDYPSHNHKLCSQQWQCCPYLERLFAFTAPKNNRFKNYVLPNDEFLNTETQQSRDASTKVNDESEESEKTDDTLFNNSIEEICEGIKDASIEYFDQLYNIMGAALINTNPKEAIKCWNSCTVSAKAMFNLAVAYETGKHSTDGTSDLNRAFHYYTIAAERGHKFAIYNLALYYLKGRGVVDIDLKRAKLLLRKAADLGVRPALEFVEYENNGLKNERNDKVINNQLSNGIEPQQSPSPPSKMRVSASVPNLRLFGQMFESMVSNQSYANTFKKLNNNDNDSIMFNHVKDNASQSIVTSSLYSLRYQ